MAFTFTVEIGNADPNANSYGAVDEALDYIEVNVAQSDAFVAADTTTQEKHLIRASFAVDNLVEWNGTRVDRDSGLRWPRAGVYDEDGFEIPDDEIPTMLKYAVFELATYLAQGDDYTEPLGTRGFKEIDVDVIRLKMTDNYIRPSLPDYIIQMLEPLGEVKRGTRPAFKKIIRT